MLSSDAHGLSDPLGGKPPELLFLNRRQMILVNATQRGTTMNKIHRLTCAAVFAALLAAVPAGAQTPTATASKDCSEAAMKAMQDSMMKMTDATKKAAVMKEMDMAKDMMAKSDEKGCMMQMDKAMGMMK
jgi:hypothetical protein